MNSADARRTARAELADYAAQLAKGADDTAARAGKDREGGKDAQRMAAAYRAVATLLDADTFPRPEVSVPPANVIPLFDVAPDGRALAEG